MPKIFVWLGIIIAICVITTFSKEKKIKAEKIGKKVTDYNDVDVEKLLDQWNEDDDEEDGDDNDDPRLKKPPKVDMKKIFQAGGKQEDILKASKKGQPLMLFANVAGNPTRTETEAITSIWQTSLRNNQIQVQRFIISDNRIIFQLEDGSQAFEVKNYLTSLENCEKVTFENMDFPGKGAKKSKTEL